MNRPVSWKGEAANGNERSWWIVCTVDTISLVLYSLIPRIIMVILGVAILRESSQGSHYILWRSFGRFKVFANTSNFLIAPRLPISLLSTTNEADHEWGQERQFISAHETFHAVPLMRL